MIKYIKKAVKEYQSIDNIILILFFVSIIALPSNLSKTWRVPSSYYQGIFYEYWSIKLYLSQILLLLTFLLTLLNLIRKNTIKPIFFLSRLSEPKNRVILLKTVLPVTTLIGILLLQTLRTTHWERTGVWFMTILLGPVVLALLLKKNRLISNFPLAILISTSLQAVIGILQYGFQKNLLPYIFLGETQFTHPLFLAKSTMRSELVILPYGTTPHPNILAGWLLVGIAALFVSRGKVLRKIFIPLLLLHLFALLLTESFSAWSTLPLIILLFLWNKGTYSLQKIGKPAFLALIILSFSFWTALPVILSHTWPEGTVPLSISRRSRPIEEVLKNPPSLFLTGAGLGQSFPILNSSEDGGNIWKFAQPIHSSGIILVFELGICILLLLSIYYVFVLNNYSFILNSFILILPVFYLDHYLTSQIMGQYVVICLMSFYALSSYHEKA